MQLWEVVLIQEWSTPECHKYAAAMSVIHSRVVNVQDRKSVMIQKLPICGLRAEYLRGDGASGKSARSSHGGHQNSRRDAEERNHVFTKGSPSAQGHSIIQGRVRGQKADDAYQLFQNRDAAGERDKSKTVRKDGSAYKICFPHPAWVTAVLSALTGGRIKKVPNHQRVARKAIRLGESWRILHYYG
jgi:hypothetical protein